MIKKKELIIGIIFIILAYYLTISSAIPVELPLQVNNLSEIKEMITDSRLKSISISHEHKGIVFEANHSNMSVNFTLNNGRVKAKAIIDYFDKNTVKKFKKINSTHWRGEAVYYDPLSIEELWVYIQGNDLVFSFPHTSSPCVNCATGTTSKTLNSLSNGSWINLTNSIQNATAGNVTFTGLLGNWNTTFGNVQVNNYIANGTGIISFNVSNLTGVNTNSSHIFMNGNLNSDFSNLNVTMDNTTKLNLWNQTENGTILIQNGFAQIFVNKTVNGTAMNVWGGNTNTKTSSNATLTFTSAFDFQNNALPSEFTQGDANAPAFANGIMTLENAAGEWVYTGANYIQNSFMLSRMKIYGNVGDGNFNTILGFISPTTRESCSSGDRNCFDLWFAGGRGLQYRVAGSTVFSSPDTLSYPNDFSLYEFIWSNSYAQLRINSTNLSLTTTTSNIPTTNLRLGFSVYGRQLDVDYVMIGKIADTAPATFGAINTLTGATIVYAIPQNHIISETKTLTQSNIDINLTLSPNIALQNVQLFTNSTTSYSATLTVNYTNNTEITNESFYNGFWIMNATFKLPVNSTNVSFNYTATYPSYDNIGTINVTSTQESNRTSTTTSGSYINTTFYQLPDIDVYINYSRAYDVLAVLTQPTNQSTVIGSTLTHSITVTDSNYLSQNISWDYEGDGTIDTYGSSNQKTYNSIGTRSGRVYVNTSTTLNTWDNQTKVFTTVVNQSITISNVTNITQAENSTVYVDIDGIGINGTARYSTNRSDLFSDFDESTGIGKWNTNYSANGTYHIMFGVNDSLNYQNSNSTMIINITNTVLPVSTSQVTPTSVTNGNTVNISLTINGSGINVTSAIVRVENPNAVVQNFTMSCSGTTDTLCFKVYTTAVNGEHLIRFFYLKDETLTENQVASLLTFTATAASSGSSGGGGGGGGGTSVTNIIVAATPTPTPIESSLNLSLIEITEGTRPISDIEAINNCLTTEFLISPRCKSATTIALTNQKNWFALSGAFMGAIVSTWGLNLSNAIYLRKRRRSYFDALIYATTAIVVTLGLNWVGFNFMFLFNYLYSNSLSAYTFATFVLWGFLTNTTMQELIFPKKTFYNVKKINL